MNLGKKTKVVILSHFTFKGSEKGVFFPLNIRNFLLDKIGTLTYIDHPFPQSNFPASQITLYECGARTYKLTSPKIEFPTLLLFIYQFFLTIFFVLRIPMRYDLAIACDNLSLISLYLMRKIGLIKKLVYYTVDYSPQRYTNTYLNSLYQRMDRLACRLSDINWVTVKEMIAAKAKNGLNIEKSAPFSIVPIGFNTEEISITHARSSSNKKSRFNLFFVGVLYEKQGLQLAIQVLPKIIKKFPEIKLTIIGSGPFEKQIKKLVIHLKLTQHVTYTGYITDHNKIVAMLRKTGGIGLATYDPAIADFTYYADPSKIKLYLLCGLPVITTHVPPIAKIIKKKKAGFVIHYSEDDLINSLETLMRNKKTFSLYRINAIKLSNKYDDNLILKRAFRGLPNNF